MAYYTHSTPKCQVKNTWLQIDFTSDITDTLGDILPYPHKHYVIDGVYTYCWLLDGFFETQKNIDYFNDLIARFLLTFPTAKYRKHYEDKSSIVTPYKLKEFQRLQSRVKARKEFLRADVMHDNAFWVLKYHAEDLIKEDGFIICQKLEDFGVNNFSAHKKGLSTIRAKCRSIYYWYEARDWKIGRKERKYNTKGELMASRSNHMKKVNKKREDDTRRKVVNILTGLLADEYKKPNGKFHVLKVAKDSGTSRNTVYKYLKELGLND
jgi:hypothetical protein